jgi:23S rRNA (cytidine1920-2'-O)/16S rRNA (cytidine1409-2'-O)-methyltransferase
VSRSRLDVALVERGLFPSRARAQAAVMAGRVRVDGRPAPKPGAAVAPEASLEVTPGREFASRGGEKLRNALDRFALDVTGARALDVGASTGGFTDCLLARGAAEVAAVDVGYGQLAWSLREDPRVHVLERVNARDLTAASLPFRPDLVTCDLSFISAALVWPAIAACLAGEWTALVLVKPQFEAGREHVGSGGVVRDPAARAAAVRRVCAAIAATGGGVRGVADSGLPGPRGNREIFVWASSAAAEAPLDLEAAIGAAVSEEVR